MKRLLPAIVYCFLSVLFAGEALAQRNLVNDVQKKNLESFSKQLSASFAAGKQRALALAPSKNWVTRKITTGGRVIALQGVNSLGFPRFLRTSNTEAAAATRTNAVQPGGELQLDLSGTGTILANKLAIWDGGTVYRDHQEFAGKTITLGVNQTGAIEHTTHVAGTMIARGINPVAKGMAFGMNTLQSFDFDNDVAEIGSNAAGLLVSNHSYGDIAGWDFDGGRWTWYGLPGDDEDYLFGFYDERAQAWDKIAFEAPYYLIVESAGNSHAYTGPSIGSTYYGYESRTDQTIVEKGPRPASISSNEAFDVISTTGNAKNILTVGSVNQLPNGPQTAAGVQVSSFSSWGPTDDGRVKPDIMGMGSSVLSTSASGPNFYSTLSGTSMASPNVSGSIFLLQEYYAQLHNDSVMRAATLKGLVCHTAFDAGNAGPDYIYGWGVLDMRKAAQTITTNGTNTYIHESTLQQAQVESYTITANSNGPLWATISWTDREGTVAAVGTLNERTPKLVNDLDVRISSSATGVVNPWVLDPANPSSIATRGDNVVDNVEQVYIPSAINGETYTVSISNKGILRTGRQDYSLIISGGRITQTSTTTPGEGLTVYPVPASEYINAMLNIKTAGTVRIQLIDIGGRIVYDNSRTVQAGNFNTQIGVTNLASGTYVLRLIAGSQVESRKVLVVRSN
ncbi:S8 family peptidase [Mucilaginibacter sp. UR6-1]|uniref:S8/S53 family peptidase n=1 Tax=Mucilaginibacter sp. UR6-1 TaxID=1435643 RepID=UPI001E4AD6BD|nr:S8/S53 family peptidase [Mucilaginibacter sp. UR6-1]MCC8410429.1 S8 family peptidase [Mucilaginibacter sp. UR6-1]